MCETHFEVNVNVAVIGVVELGDIAVDNGERNLAFGHHFNQVLRHDGVAGNGVDDDAAAHFVVQVAQP